MYQAHRQDFGTLFTTMPNIQLDNVQFSSFHESFMNRQVITSGITVSGSIPGGSHKQFSVDVPIVRGSAVFEVYSKVGSSPRRRVDGCSQALDISWTYNVYIWVSQPSQDVLRLIVDVDNPGPTATISAQTMNFTIYVFDTPFV